MRRRLRTTPFRNSLAFKVIFYNVLLGLVVVSLTGSTLYKQLSTGIKKVKIESSLGEAKSRIFNAQYRILVATDSEEKTIKQIMEDVVVNSPGVAGESGNGREVAILRTSQRPTEPLNLQSTSNLILVNSVPPALRHRVQKSSTIEWAYSTIYYQDGTRIPGLVAGERISIPNAGPYEMYLLFNLNSQNATLALLSRALYISGIFLLFLIALLTLLVVRQVVRPVREAARIAEGFTAGNLNQRMYIEGKDEIARLGTAFNEMALSLQQQISRLENLSRVQQRFVSDVSHELRTPLTTLRMASEVIYGAREQFDSNIARSAELLVAQLDRFERLLEDLLEVSRFDAEVAVLEIVEFDIVTLISRCISDLSLLARESATSIELLGSNRSVLVSADIRRVERILRNLLTNAIEYSEGKGIEVTIASSETVVAVGVRDHGVGLDEQSAFRVFDRFWRADLSRARVRGGTGLGLSISLEDARLHNGELEAWGRPGEGAHFVLSLPRRAGGEIEARLIKLQPPDYLSTKPAVGVRRNGAIPQT
jgi:two-component system sensor histidine kinase MtrB